eukprot:TRINITY_DN26237_c0_g1_i1.p1 TRINITY_DN26237_c0_g1~~TRINITY_DN26237_c0_g1_i1.p1  ORF type:complete len:855 (+),score=149.77 TRINITY_DN26237_c0_g1_i1:59-2623(+)
MNLKLGIFSLFLCLFWNQVIYAQYLNTYHLKSPNATTGTNFGTSAAVSISSNPLLAISDSEGYVYIYSLTPIAPSNADYINYTLIPDVTTTNQYNVNSSTNYYPTLSYVVPPALPTNILSTSYTAVAITANQIAISYTNSQFDPFNSTFNVPNSSQSAVAVYSHVKGQTLYPDPSSSRTFIFPPSGDTGNFGGSFPGALAIYSNWLFIGSPTADSGAGRFYIYYNNFVSTTGQTDGAWTLRATFYGNQLGSNYLTGNSIAISEDSGLAVVGSPGSNSGSGSVYLFDLNNMKTSANQTNSFLYSTADPISLSLSEFGYAVAVSTSGRYVIVSAPGSNAVFIYQPSVSGPGFFGETKIQLNLIYSMVAPRNYGATRFGTSVGVNDDGTAVIGTTTGLVFVYQFGNDGNILTPTSLTTPSQVFTVGNSTVMNNASVSPTSPPASGSNSTTNLSSSGTSSTSLSASISPSHSESPSVSSALPSISSSPTLAISNSSAASSSSSNSFSPSRTEAPLPTASTTNSRSSDPAPSGVKRNAFFTRQSSSQGGPNTYGLSVVTAGGNGYVNDLIIVTASGDNSVGSSSSLVFPKTGATEITGTGSVFLYTQCQFSLIGAIQNLSPTCLLSSNDIYLSNSVDLQPGQGISLAPNSRLVVLGDLNMNNGSYLNTSIDSIVVVQNTFSVSGANLFVGVSNDSYLNNVKGENGGNGNQFALVQYGALRPGNNEWKNVNSEYLYGSRYYQRCGSSISNQYFSSTEYSAYVNRDGGCYSLDRPNGSGQSTNDYIIGAFLGAFGPCIVISALTLFFWLLVKALKKVKNYIWPRTEEDEAPLVPLGAHDDENPETHDKHEVKSEEGSSTHG